MSRKSKTDHILIEDTSTGAYRMFCEHCGRDTLIVPPVSIDMFLAMGRQFSKEHRDCRVQEAPSPADEGISALVTASAKEE